MAGLVPAIEVFFRVCSEDVNARHKAGHDDLTVGWRRLSYTLKMVSPRINSTRKITTKT